jgi:hypothetical protein
MKTTKPTCSKNARHLGHSGALYAMPARKWGCRTELTPEATIGRHPATNAALGEAQEEERASKVPPQFGSIEEFEAWRETEEHERFIGQA